MSPDIIFPHLGIKIENLSKGIQIGDFTLAFYGIIIALGMVLGFLLAFHQAKRTNQEPDIYLDVAIWGIICAILGARIYYVLFSWDYYSAHPLEIINIRGGGLAIYGGLIGGILAAFVVTKIKKYPFLLVLDTAATSLLLGQALGRWGNFFNREAFGGYTNNPFAMQIKLSDVSLENLTGDLDKHLVNVNGVNYIQVHPTFLYESVWNLILLILLYLYTPKKKFEGEIFTLYVMGYSFARFWIESLRVDQLMLFGTSIPVSMFLSGLLFILSTTYFIYKRVHITRKKN